jgi:RND superfamily putative drug exporter
LSWRCTDWLAGLPAGRIGAWLVLAAWVVVAVALVPLAGKVSGVEQNDSAAWLPRSAETTRAYEVARAAFPESSRMIAVVVYARDGGLTRADLAKAEADRAALAGYGWQGQAGPVVPATDGSAVLYALALDGAADGTGSLPDTVRTLKERAGSGAPEGLRTGVAGPAASTADFAGTLAGTDTVLLYTTVGVVTLILLVTYRSPILWVVPLVSVGVASQVTQAVVYLLAKYANLTATGQSVGILTVLVFGAGTDYALLLVARYREELHRHRDQRAAMVVALRRCLPTVLASGATVVLGMLCLVAAQLNSTRGLGPVAAVGVAIAVLVMITLLPALLVIFGRWLFWPFVPRFDPAAGAGPTGTERGGWHRVAAVVDRYPRALWVGTSLVLVALAFGSLTLRFGMTQEENFTTTVESVTAQHLLDQHFPSGSSAPATIYTTPASAEAVASAARTVDGVTTLGAVRPAQGGEWVAIDAVLRDPADSAVGERTVQRLRHAVHAAGGSRSLVGGATATQIDVNRAVAHDNRVVIPLILCVVLIVLMVLLRALVAPVLLMATVVVSFLGSFGAAALVFAALGRATTDRQLPLYGFLFLTALGVDYTIFLMSRAREEATRIGSRAGTLRALVVTGGVITSAGVLLAATFAVLAVLPMTFMLQLGLVVAIGVLIDTLVVRTLLVPALAVDQAARIWWPSRAIAVVAAATDLTPAPGQCPERAALS